MSKYKRLTNKNWKENYDIFEDVCCDILIGNIYENSDLLSEVKDGSTEN